MIHSKSLHVAGLAASLAASLATLLAGAPVLGVEASGPTVEQVLTRAIEALGGRAAWDRIESLELRGTLATFSSTHPFQLRRKRPNLYRFDHFEADLPVTIGFDGRQAWWEYGWVPFSEVDWATVPPLVYARGFEADAELTFPYVDADERGHQVTVLGRDELDGAATWQLEIAMRNGTVETWHLDAQSYLPILRTSRAGYTGLDAELRTYFSDWRTVSGVLLPHHVETELRNRFGVMEVAEVAVNVPIDDAVFRLPLTPTMAALKTLAGRWKVAVESRQMPNLPWLPSETTSTIEALHDGRVLEERLSYLFFGKPRNVLRLYSHDRFRDQLEIVHLDDLTNHPIVLVGAAVGTGQPPARLEASNLTTHSSWGVWQQTYHHRQVLDELSRDSFRVEWDVSLDNGQTWSTLARFHYTRLPTE